MSSERWMGNSQNVNDLSPIRNLFSWFLLQQITSKDNLYGDITEIVKDLDESSLEEVVVVVGSRCILRFFESFRSIVISPAFCFRVDSAAFTYFGGTVPNKLRKKKVSRGLNLSYKRSMWIRCPPGIPNKKQ